MQHQTILEVNRDGLHLFLQGGFFDLTSITTLIHSHGYTEIHLVVNGEVRFLIDEKDHTFTSGDIFAIPPNTYHHCIAKTDNAQTVAFQIKRQMDTIQSSHISPVLAADFVREIKLAEQANDYGMVLKYLSLFCRLLFEEETVPSKESTDYSLIINEFFSNRYSQPVTILSLAQELNLSEKQTARLVKKHTGNTFNQELTLRRMNAANYLMKSTKMTLGEIAEYVGFKSYSGFWKVYKKQAARDD